ncbi:MAG: VWA domain-containing protein [Verrucomicrobia bacterium]|nr:VWA domain-containing protein [Verrucomicrobiota bacterium]
MLRHAFALAALALTASPLRAAPTEIELVLDASGSMWNKLEDGRFRIDAAKQVLAEFIAQAPNDPNLRLGLRIYGARVHYSKPGACQDSVLVVPIGPLERARLLKEVRETRAVGATPLAYSLSLALQDFRERGRKQVIVCTDGEESCGGDVAAAVKALKELGADVDVRFIGIGLPPAAAERLGKIAPIENVNSARRLAEALRTATRGTVTPPVAPAATPVPGAKVSPPPPPPPVPPGTVSVRVVRDRQPLSAPAVSVSFAPDLGAGGPVELKPSGADFTATLPAGSYTATVKPGGRTFSALGVVAGEKSTFTFDLTEPPKVKITPEKTTVLAGSTLKASFSGAKGVPDQYLVIARVGSPDTEEPSYVQVEGAEGSGELSVPDAPGDYEIRFTSRVAEGGGYVLSGRSAPIKATAASASVEAPATALAGSSVQVRWSGPNRVRDWVGFIRKGGTAGDYLGWTPAEGEARAAEIDTPAQAGEYEIVYANDNSGQILARRPIRITAPAATLSAPASAMAGADVPITWGGTTGKAPYVTIVKAGSPDDAYNDYVTLGDDVTVELAAPDETGDFEVRLNSDQTKQVLARRPLKLTAPAATIEAPASVTVGAEFEVKAGGRLAKGDLVGLFPAGAGPEAEALDYLSMVNGPTGKLTVGKPGAYELRYYGKSGKVIARRPLTAR